MSRSLVVSISSWLGVLALGCSSTYEERLAPVRHAFYADRLEEARAVVEELIAEEGEEGADHHLLLLERSVVELALGQPARAERDLLLARDRFADIAEAEAAAFGSEVASYFTDDRFASYAGEDFERVLIPTFLAFTELLEHGDDAVAYANQVLETQRALLDQQPPVPAHHEYKANYRRVGVGAYLYGLVTEERDPTAGSEVVLSYERVRAWEPEFDAIGADIERAARGVHSAPGHGVLYVFAFVGKGPIKVEREESDLTFASEIALQFTRLIPAVAEAFGPTLDLSPLRVPVMVARPGNNIRAVEVAVDGGVAAVTATVTDVTATALQHYSEIKDWVYGKAIARRMVKKAITTAAKGAAVLAVEGDRRRRSSDEQLAVAAIELGGILVNSLWSAAERADTRHWSLLPDTIQVARVELPVGDHRVLLTPRLDSGAVGLGRSVDVRIDAARNTYVVAFVPEPGVGPGPRASRTPAEAEAIAGR